MRLTAHQNIKVAPAITPASYSAAGDTAGLEIDTLGYDEALVVFHLGIATGTVAFDVWDCATTGGTFAAVTGTAAPATGTYDSTEDVTVYVARLDLRNFNRFIKVYYDVDTDVVLMSAAVILLAAKEAPVTQVNTAVFSV